MSAAAVIMRRQRQLIRGFAERRATCPDAAIAFADLGMRRSWIFDRLVARGVFVDAGQDRFYMNEEAAQAFLQAQRRRALTITGILLVFFLVFLLTSWLW
jgi:hypothetical protein